jgi:arsenate reductase
MALKFASKIQFYLLCGNLLLMIKIFHNPRCGKSREGLQILENQNQPFEIIKYLESSPTVSELQDLIKLLKIEPLDLVRQKEKIWIENFKKQDLTQKEIIQAMVDYPILIERPIVVNGNKAIIGRPPSLIKEIFN